MTLSFAPLQSDARASFAYYGSRKGWLIVLGQHRDSDALERSNWHVISNDLLTRFPEDVAIERFNHWLVGWSESLITRPGSPAVRAAEEWVERLDQYPVADDDDYANLELDEEWCVRCDSGTRSDHPLKRCPKFRSEEDADEIRWKWRNR